MLCQPNTPPLLSCHTYSTCISEKKFIQKRHGVFFTRRHESPSPCGGKSGDGGPTTRSQPTPSQLTPACLNSPLRGNSEELWTGYVCLIHAMGRGTCILVCSLQETRSHALDLVVGYGWVFRTVGRKKCVQLMDGVKFRMLFYCFFSNDILRRASCFLASLFSHCSERVLVPSMIEESNNVHERRVNRPFVLIPSIENLNEYI